MRGMPGEARIVVEAADGTLLPVIAVRPMASVAREPGNVTGATGYTIVLEFGELQSDQCQQ